MIPLLGLDDLVNELLFHFRVRDHHVFDRVVTDDEGQALAGADVRGIQ